MGHECPTYRYRASNGLCCRLCQPGTYVATPCTLSVPTICKKCNEGTYMEKWNNFTKCDRCTICDRGQIYSESCTPSKNSECVCPGDYYKNVISSTCAKCSICADGYYMVRDCGKSNNRECKKCNPGERGDGKRCYKAVSNQKPVKDMPPTGLIVTLAVVSICIVIVIVCFVVWYLYRRSQRNHSTSQFETRNSPSGVETTYNCDVLCPQGDMSVQNLDYDVFSKLAIKLNPRARRNWKDLADKMGYSIDYIRSLDLDKTEATQDLLYDFGTQKKGTVRRLYNLLLEIKRKDAADILLPYLNQSPV